jgi:3-hydroxybutyryl-CoA dehydrogenase
VPVDANKDDLLIGVSGAGAMGRGIVQVAAAGGVNVRLFDINADQCKEAVDFIGKMLGRAADKGRMAQEDADAAMGRIEVVADVKEFAPCDIVIEAATENLEIKKKIFAQLEEVVREDAIIATNTSSLSVTTIASACSRPQRVAGFHFFNPVPLMRLVNGSAMR